MANRDEGLFRMIRRNKLLGMWAAEQLGLVGERAEASSTELLWVRSNPKKATCSVGFA